MTIRHKGVKLNYYSKRKLNKGKNKYNNNENVFNRIRLN